MEILYRLRVSVCYVQKFKFELGQTNEFCFVVNLYEWVNQVVYITLQLFQSPMECVDVVYDE